MARRFGGRHSPRGIGAGQGAATFRGSARAGLLYVPAALVLLTSIGSGALGLALGALSAAFLAGSAWLLREGLRAEHAYRARRIARRPAIPRKILAADLAGIGIGIAAWRNEHDLLAAVIYGVVTMGLFLAAFGLDPLRSKGRGGADGFQRDRVARAVSEAEAYLAEMERVVAELGARDVAERVAAFAARARELLRTVEADPRDLVAARRFMGVYLMGARDATVKFADIYARTGDAAARRDYLALIADLEKSFDEKTRGLMLDENADLAVEIEVLRERLKREGVGL